MSYKLEIQKSADELVQIYTELEEANKKLKMLLSGEEQDEAKLLLQTREASRKIAELTAKIVTILDKR
ncbi:MAG: hypothetical protein FDX02_03155 [Chlorobium sp.]|nr:MAG: hypothetical protein FDX02_03155 [Chlorobium sp.]